MMWNAHTHDDDKNMMIWVYKYRATCDIKKMFSFRVLKLFQLNATKNSFEQFVSVIILLQHTI